MASENFSLAVVSHCLWLMQKRNLHGLFELLLLEEFVSFRFQSVGHDGAFDGRAAEKVEGILNRMGLIRDGEGFGEQ
jgi:hypothetical protein